MTYLVLVAAAVVVIALIALVQRRRAHDGVASFQRHIDALSSEARKPVVEQVQEASERRASTGDDDSVGDDAAGEDTPNGA